MKEFKGTPGPWRFDEQTTLSGGQVFYIAQDDNAKYTPNYSDVSQTCSGELKHIQKANAQLIAAAPDLLEALQGYMSAVSEMNEAMKDGYNVQGAMSALIGWEDMARAAISKALGEE
ncbi:hypothetical protein [Enterobacter sp. 18A13]|uniref:hypothetical protein n=1 Tax=Enterobacter sp. 18A13 TaxID=2565914 RepID=UPI0010CA2670|nr:hypothetical protein [Enterobacter sp. 18A13]BBJ66287.1 hypothetical protein ECC18A13_008520 [Enterobacter sp. 18A13]